MQVEKYNNNYVKCNGEMEIEYCRECPYYCSENNEFIECADDSPDIYFKLRKVNRIRDDLKDYYGRK